MYNFLDFFLYLHRSHDAYKRLNIVLCKVLELSRYNQFISRVAFCGKGW